jgi:hypothetical protein
MWHECKINNAMLVKKTFFKKMLVFASPTIIHVHKLFFWAFPWYGVHTLCQN